MRAPSVFFVIDAYDGPSSGTEKQLLMLIKGLVARGFAPHLFVFRHTPYTRTVTGFPCPIECLGIQSMRAPATLGRMLAFRRRVRDARPIAVHAFFNDTAILVPLFTRMTGVRVLTSRRDMGFWYTRGRLALLRLANRRVDRIVCNAVAVADEVHRRERVPGEKLAVIYNGLDLAEFLAIASPTDEPNISQHDNAIRICLIANLRPIKRIEDFIRAASRISPEVPEARFIVVGESLNAEYERALHVLVEKFGLGEQFEFTGHSHNPARILRDCHIGVLASESEGLSNAVLEYLAFGLPVVCSDVGGNGELVIHGENGFMYAAGDADELAGHLLHLCTHPRDRERLGAASLERARAFSPERMVEAHAREYRSGQDRP